MPLQDHPVCFECHDPVDEEPVFEAACGHEECPSVVFHALCLFAWRERRAVLLREHS